MVSHPEGDFMRPNGVKHAFKLVEHPISHVGAVAVIGFNAYGDCGIAHIAGGQNGSGKRLKIA
jgi:hypothetical protein